LPDVEVKHRHHLHIIGEAMTTHIPTLSTVKMNKIYQSIHFLLPPDINMGMIAPLNHGTFKQL
jgi:hypothetical protein